MQKRAAKKEDTAAKGKATKRPAKDTKEPEQKSDSESEESEEEEATSEKVTWLFHLLRLIGEIFEILQLKRFSERSLFILPIETDAKTCSCKRRYRGKGKGNKTTGK